MVSTTSSFNTTGHDLIVLGVIGLGRGFALTAPTLKLDPRVLAVIDDYSRECLALVADTSLSRARVARELDTIIAKRGSQPKTIVSDNGTEFTSMPILKWCQDTKVGWRLHRARQATTERLC